jgi:hypothetical protein
MRRDIAIGTLRRCGEALAGELSAAERQRMLEMYMEALRVIECYDERRHRPATVERGARIRTLERQMADKTAGERVRAICERMGISRPTYFRLRKNTHESHKQ